MEGDHIQMHDLFAFEQTGVDDNGHAVGRFICTGIRPRSAERIEHRGIRLPGRPVHAAVMMRDRESSQDATATPIALSYRTAHGRSPPHPHRRRARPSSAGGCSASSPAARGGSGDELAQRLSNEGRPGVTLASTEARPILIRAEVPGVPPALAGTPAHPGPEPPAVQAYPTVSVMRFLAIAGGAAAGGFLLGFAVLDRIARHRPARRRRVRDTSPFVLLGRRRAKRQKQIADQLPEALDFLSRVLKAGHSFSTGLQMMAESSPSRSASEFRRCYDQHSLGQPLEDALREAAAAHRLHRLRLLRHRAC